VLQTILNAFKVPEIRRKLAFTAAMLALYRLGTYIPAPGIDIGSVGTSVNSRATTSSAPEPVGGGYRSSPCSRWNHATSLIICS
jgi:preprotein translocase subunit SecY